MRLILETDFWKFKQNTKILLFDIEKAGTSDVYDRKPHLLASMNNIDSEGVHGISTWS